MSRLITYAKHGARILIGKRAKLPSYIILFVTSRCNSRCNHCFYWKDINAHKEELTFDEIKKLSSELKEVTNLALSGGEPVLRDDLPEICELFHENNRTKNIHLPTNGLATGIIKSKVEKILQKANCDLTVAISLDGLKETHDAIRGVNGNFESVLNTYKEIAKLKSNYSNLKLFVNTVISNKNHKEIAQLVHFVKENMPELDGYGFDWIRGNPKNKDFSIPSIDRVKELTPFIKETQKHYLKKTNDLRSKIESGVRSYLSDLKYDILKTESQYIPCIAGEIFAVIYPHGDVSLCELLPPVGNLRKQSLETAWNSPKAEEQRKSIQSKKCWCTHGCFQPTNAMLYPQAYPKIIKNIIKG